MRKQFYEHLPRNYFSNLFPKVIASLLSGDNVAVATLYGGGGKTFLNFFIYWAKKEKIFDQILYFDLDLAGELEKNIKFKQSLTTTLVIIRNIENHPDKKSIITKLNSLRQPNHNNLLYLFITNESPITNPREFYSEKGPFFSSLIYIRPFNTRESEELLNITCSYYGWSIDRKLYPEIFALAGGIPRLLKHVCKEMVENNLDLSHTSSFIKSFSILFELEYLAKLLMTLPKDELSFLGLIDSKNKITSKLLQEFFGNYEAREISKIYPSLTKSESKILSCLIANKNSIVSLDRLADILEMGDNDFSLWALYKAISRLNLKVPGKIKNIKGQGYIINS